MEDSSASGIEVSGLHFSYAREEFALRLEEFHAQPGEAVAISGPSGCGKSTLLRLMCGLLVPEAGSVRIGGGDVTRMTAEKRRALRLRRMGVVFQDFALLDYLTVEENLLLPMRLGGFIDAEAATRARELSARLGIAQYWGKLAGALSQGERQRAAIARALAHRPAFVFADETTASLDVRRRDAAGELLMGFARENAAPLVLVTHDTELMRRFDRVVDFEKLMTP